MLPAAVLGLGLGMVILVLGLSIALVQSLQLEARAQRLMASVRKYVDAHLARNVTAT